MELIQEGGMSASSFVRRGFLGHVFNTSDESNAEIMNITQYTLLSVIPVVMLNKIVQRFIPEADPDKSSLEILVEIILQLVLMFVGIVFIHRIVTFAPTYSGYKYEHLTLTNAVIAFLVVVLSIQTKLGIKTNILFDRVVELWNGEDSSDRKRNVRNKVRFSEGMSAHMPSQADHLDTSGSSFMPPTSMTSTRQPANTYDTMMRGGPSNEAPGPMAANSVLGGGGFGSFF